MRVPASRDIDGTRALDLTATAETSHFWFRGFRRFLAPVLAEIAGGRRGLRLIDCGAGTGANLALLRPHGEVFAFDLAPSGLTAARALQGPLVRADITRIPFQSESFDVVTSFDVLQSVPEDGAAIAEMARIVRPGGSVVLTLSALDVLWGDHGALFHEVRRYTPRIVRARLAEAGLEPVRVSFMFGSVFPLIFGARLWQRLTQGHRTPSPGAELRVPAAPVNGLLTALVAGEAALAPYVRTPVGSSLLVVARKP